MRKLSNKIRNLKPKKKKQKKLRTGLGLMGWKHGGGTGDYVLDSIRPKSAVHRVQPFAIKSKMRSVKKYLSSDDLL